MKLSFCQHIFFIDNKPTLDKSKLVVTNCIEDFKKQFLSATVTTSTANANESRTSQT